MNTSNFEWPPLKIVSGGQTGVDRAALDWAIQHNIAHGGWCPKGRLATDGPLPLRYHLSETQSSGYRQRTKLNVMNSDVTLILNIGALDGGTLQTVKFAETLNRPHYVFQLDLSDLATIAELIADWWQSLQLQTLNIAGPREEKRPGIYQATRQTLDLCLLSRAMTSSA